MSPSDLIPQLEALRQFPALGSYATHKRRRARGEGPPEYVIGGRVFLRRCDIQAYLETCRREPGTTPR